MSDHYDDHYYREEKRRKNELVSSVVMSSALAFLLGFLACHKLYTAGEKRSNPFEQLESMNGKHNQITEGL